MFGKHHLVISVHNSLVDPYHLSDFDREIGFSKLENVRTTKGLRHFWRQRKLRPSRFVSPVLVHLTHMAKFRINLK